MSLTEAQKNRISQWAADGANLSEIQTRLADEFGMRLSFMETRFLILDLGTQIKDKEPEPVKTAPAKPAAPVSENADAPRGFSDDDETDEDDETEMPEQQQAPANPASAVSVDINPIARPGFALTGTVVFTDGVKCEWGITNDGRFALESETPGYKPTNEDFREFQIQLRKQMAKKGY